MLAALVATGCGGSGAREQVDTYVKRVNAVQADAAPALAEADRSYGKVVRRKLGDPTVVPQLVAAEKTIRETQARVARIPAPPPARRLREQLLRLYELNGGLARETVLLGRYVPERRKVLERVARANRRMSRAIARADQPRAQAATFAAYRDRLDSAITALERLQPPPVSAAAHDQQLRRLRASRRLAGSLRRAVLARDPARTARLVVAFRQVGSVRAGERALQARELVDYAKRRRAVSRAIAAVRRERAGLDRRSE